MFSKIILQNLWRSGKHVRQKLKTETQQAVESQTFVKPKVGWQSQTFKKLVDSTARQTIKQAFWRGRNDKNILLFAFAGFVIAKQSEEDKRLSEVQNIIHVKDQSDDLEHPSLSFQGHELSLELLEIGRHIGQGCNAAVYDEMQTGEVEVVTETEETELKDSDEVELENEDSDTESEITVLSSTSQDASAPAVVNVHEYDEEWNIRGGNDEVCDVSIPGWTGDEMEPWPAVFIDQLEDLKDSDEWEIDNEDSDTESDIAVLSSTSQYTHLPFYGHEYDDEWNIKGGSDEYDDEWNIKGGSDEVCDVSIPGWTEDEMEPWSEIDMEDLKDSDGWEFEHEDSDTESDITVLSSTSQDTSLPFNVQVYDDELNIRGGSDYYNDVAVLEWIGDEMENWSAIDSDHLEDLKDSDKVEFENEDSDTESDITVLSSTSQYTSLPAVVNVHEYGDEWNISGDSDDYNDVSVLDWTEAEEEPWSAVDMFHMEDLNYSDEREFVNEDSATESVITVMPSAYQDASALPVVNVHEYDAERNIRGGNDEVCNVSFFGWREDEMEPWSAVIFDYMKDPQTSSDVQSKAPSSSGVRSFKFKEKNKISKRARESFLHSLKKKRLCLEIALLEQKIAHDKELHQMLKEMLSRDHMRNI